jgi:hypothetical protein
MDKLQAFMRQQGPQSAILVELEYGDRKVLYINVVDCTISILVMYSGCRVNEIEALEIANWEAGTQNNPIGSRFSYYSCLD